MNRVPPSGTGAFSHLKSVRGKGADSHGEDLHAQEFWRRDPNKRIIVDGQQNGIIFFKYLHLGAPLGRVPAGSLTQCPLALRH